MTMQWVAADLHTCKVLADLPSVSTDDGETLRRSISNVDTAVVHLNLTDAIASSWERASRPGAAVLACYDDEVLPDGSQPQAIEWAGYVTYRQRDGADDAIDLTLSTLEGYLDRRFVEDESYATSWGWRDIAADLVTKYINDQTGLPGVPLLTSYTGAGASPDAKLIWQNTDNVTVLGRLNELVAQFGGEYTIDWSWSADHTSLVPTLRIGDRLGTDTPAGRVPAVSFDLPGSITAVTMDEDYSSDNGANHVTYYSNGEGTYTPYAPPAIVSDFEGAPVFEYRASPVASETNLTRLTAMAAQALKVLAPGAQLVSMTVARTNSTTRRYGVDWLLGDDIGYQIGDMLPFPGGLSGVGRVIAVSVGDDVIVPEFAQPEIYQGM